MNGRIKSKLPGPGGLIIIGYTESESQNIVFLSKWIKSKCQYVLKIIQLPGKQKAIKII